MLLLFTMNLGNAAGIIRPVTNVSQTEGTKVFYDPNRYERTKNFNYLKKWLK